MQVHRIPIKLLVLGLLAASCGEGPEPRKDPTAVTPPPGVRFEPSDPRSPMSLIEVRGEEYRLQLVDADPAPVEFEVVEGRAPFGSLAKIRQKGGLAPLELRFPKASVPEGLTRVWVVVRYEDGAAHGALQALGLR